METFFTIFLLSLSALVLCACVEFCAASSGVVFILAFTGSVECLFERVRVNLFSSHLENLGNFISLKLYFVEGRWFFVGGLGLARCWSIVGLF